MHNIKISLIQFYQRHLLIYTFSIFNRQFKVTEDVPNIYSRERQVLLGIYIISIVIGLRSYNISSYTVAKISSIFYILKYFSIWNKKHFGYLDLLLLCKYYNVSDRYSNNLTNIVALHLQLHFWETVLKQQ